MLLMVPPRTMAPSPFTFIYLVSNSCKEVARFFFDSQITDGILMLGLP